MQQVAAPRLLRHALCFAVVRSSAHTLTPLLQAKDAKRAEVKAKKLEKAGLGPNTLTKK